MALDPMDPARLTDAEKLAKCEEWAPSAGAYEIKGNAIVTHNLIAKQVKGVGLTEEATIQFAGDTFTATAKSPPGSPPGERSTTYTRVR